MDHSCFNSQEITLLTAVLDRVCADHDVVDETRRMRIGKSLFLKAQTGERRFHALADYAAHGGVIPQLQEKSSTPERARYRFSMIDPAADE